MSIAKDDIIQMIRNLPENATVEDIQYHLYVLEKIAKGKQAIEAGQGIPHELATNIILQHGHHGK